MNRHKRLRDGSWTRVLDAKSGPGKTQKYIQPKSEQVSGDSNKQVTWLIESLDFMRSFRTSDAVLVNGGCELSHYPNWVKLCLISFRTSDAVLVNGGCDLSHYPNWAKTLNKTPT